MTIDLLLTHTKSPPPIGAKGQVRGATLLIHRFRGGDLVSGTALASWAIPWALITVPASGEAYLVSRSVRSSQVHSSASLTPALTLPGSLRPVSRVTRPVRSYSRLFSCAITIAAARGFCQERASQERTWPEPERKTPRRIGMSFGRTLGPRLPAALLASYNEARSKRVTKERHPDECRDVFREDFGAPPPRCSPCFL